MLTSPSEQSRVIEDPARLLLDMAQVRTTGELLDFIVRRLGESPAVVLARIWLIRPGEGCATCLLRSECSDQTSCLHLVASAGSSQRTPDEHYRRLDGDFRRFPLGVRKVGRIAATGQSIEVPDLSVLPDWVMRPEWVREEGVMGFGGQPLIFRGEVLGVLAVFSRTAIGSACFDWLRMIADHAASALANTTAWEEVAKLQERLALENQYLQEEVRIGEALGGMVGRSPALETVSRQIEMVGPTDSTVLVLGESGTGKELVAREIHRRSLRADRPLIKVNCAAIPRELYDSEFFGHTRGSFTGAVRDRVGRFELAHGGTLFLDEIGEIPLDLQSKLLRVLQEGEVQRVGEEHTRKVDVRIIAATNRDLLAESEAGRFRSDLFYRLSVFPLAMPALRHRKEDLPLLAEYFLEQLARRLGRPKLRLSVANVQTLKQHDWPGNIRELQHALERAVITANGDRLQLDFARHRKPPAGVPTASAGGFEGVLTDADVRALEAENIRRALQASNGRIYGQGGAAGALGLKPTTLASRMKSLGIRVSVRVE